MNNLGYSQAIQLQTALMPIAYLLCTLGLLLSVFRHWGNFHEILMTLVGIAVIVFMVNGYPTALTTVADAFKQLRQQTTANTPGASWTGVFQVKFENPAWDQIAEKIALLLCEALKGIGQVSIWFLDWVQSWAFNGLIAISPVLIGALAVPWTQGVGINFLMTSFGVAAWHLGIALVDILLASAASQIFTFAGVSGGVAAGTTISLGLLPVFLGALAAIVLVAICLYLAVPLVIATVLRGGSPLTAGAKAGMEMALAGFGMASVAGSSFAAKQAAAGGAGSDSASRQALTGTLRSQGSGGKDGDEGGGSFAKPLPRTAGGGGAFQPEASQQASKEEPGKAQPAAAQRRTDTERQADIISSYEPTPGVQAPRRASSHRSENELKRRQAEAHQTLEELDENYT